MKKNLLLIIMLVVSTNISNAQNKNNGEYIIPAVVNEKWGFINEYGQWIVEPKFESIDDFKTNGLALIKQNNKYGVINTSGEIVVKPQYDNIRIVGDLILVQINKKWGRIDKQGKIVVKPQYDNYEDLHLLIDPGDSVDSVIEAVDE